MARAGDGIISNSADERDKWPIARRSHSALDSAYAPVPVLTQPPVPMLAQLESRLPRGDVWRYEPKLDGFRGLRWHRTASTVQLLSRNTRDLGPWFPELMQAGQKLPVGTLIDGEIVIADDEGCTDFTALQVRLSSARNRVSRIALERAAILVAFDALEIDGSPLVDEPLAVRREHLEGCSKHATLAYSSSSKRPTWISRRIGSSFCRGSRGWWPSAPTAAMRPGEAETG